MITFSKNPGIFTPMHIDYTVPVLVPIVGALIVLGMAIVAFALVNARRERFLKSEVGTVIPSRAFAALITVCIFGIAAGLSLMVLGLAVGDSLDSARDAHRATYDKSVSSWLRSDYGINATPDKARRLLAGESFAVSYEDRLISVSLLTTLDDQLALVDASHQVVPSR